MNDQNVKQSRPRPIALLVILSVALSIVATVTSGISWRHANQAAPAASSRLLGGWVDDIGGPQLKKGSTSYPKRKYLTVSGATVTDDATTNMTTIAVDSASAASPVADLAALRALSTIDGTVINGQSRRVGADPTPWIYNSTSGAGFADDAQTVVKPGDIALGTNGRWYKATSAPVLPTIAALRLAVAGVHDSISLQAYSALNDGGGGIFDYDSSDTTSADNGGTIIVAGTRRYYRRVNNHDISPTWFGARADNATDASDAIDLMVASLGDTSRMRPAHIVLPNGTIVISRTIPFYRKSIILTGSGFGSGAGTSSAIRWIGTTTDPMIRLRQSWGPKLENFRLIGNSTHKPSAAIDLNVAGGEAAPHNTGITLAHLWIGGISGEDPPDLPTSTMSTTLLARYGPGPAVTLSGALLPAYQIHVEVTTGATLASGNMRFKVSLNGGSSYVATGAVGAATYNIPTTSPTVTLNFSAGTYATGNWYDALITHFTAGIVFDGDNAQNDQSTIRDVHIEDIEDVGIDIQNGQSTIIKVDESRFNNMVAGVRFKSRGLVLSNSFFSSLTDCVQLAADSGLNWINSGAEGAGRLVNTTAGGTGPGVTIKGEYFQANSARIPADGSIVKISGGGSSVYLDIQNMNFSGDGTISPGQTKIQISNAPHVIFHSHAVGFDDSQDLTYHADFTPAVTETRDITWEGNALDVYRNVYKFGDPTQLSTRIDIAPYPGQGNPTIAAGQPLQAIDTTGAQKDLIQLIRSGGFANRVQIGSGTVPVIIANDMGASTSGLDIGATGTAFRNVFGLLGRVSFDSASTVATVRMEDLTTNNVAGHELVIQGQNETGTTSTGGDLALVCGSGTSTSGSLIMRTSGGTVRMKVNGTGLGLYATTPVAQASRVGQLTDNTAGTPGSTLAALPDPTDSPASADALRDDIVANLLPVLRNWAASCAAKQNATETANHNLGVTQFWDEPANDNASFWKRAAGDVFYP